MPGLIKIEPAATIMILRENDGLEVLMLRRNQSLKFAPGFWVFPGGRIDAAELEASSSLDEAARIAAVREANEECGLRIPMQRLKQYYHWTTPAGGNRRYGTWFFHAHLKEEVDHIEIDGHEIVDFDWLSPSDALRKMENQRMPMLPPTLISLLRIQDCSCYPEVIHEFERTGVIKVNPVVDKKNGTFYSMYEGDAGYEEGDASAKGARHRLTMQLRPLLYHFEYHDCTSHQPILGRSKI